jgi:ubiquinone/menaquinone biosynthesis C-methylase UbiE
MAYTNHLELLKDLIQPRPHISVLDIGTGNGQSALPLIDLFERVVGIDVNQEAIRNGQKSLKKQSKRLVLKVMDGATLRFRNATFDCVTNFWTFHHFRLLPQVLEEIYRVLRPGGLIFAVDHLDRLGNPRQNNYLNLHKLKIEVENKLGKNHFNLLRPELIVKKLASIGFNETGFELFLKNSAATINQEESKERLIEMANQVRKSIEQLDSNKEEFGKRLKEIENQLLKSGVERPPYYAVFGFTPANNNKIGRR